MARGRSGAPSCGDQPKAHVHRLLGGAVCSEVWRRHAQVAGGKPSTQPARPGQLETFWATVVEGDLFTSSNERKYLGFQLFTILLPHLRCACAGCQPPSCEWRAAKIHTAPACCTSGSCFSKRRVRVGDAQGSAAPRPCGMPAQVGAGASGVLSHILAVPEQPPQQRCHLAARCCQALLAAHCRCAGRSSRDW